ncbi:FecR family protein [Sphingobacterium hotanense]|uniref:FecR family protein n=1 Tax=Sphingobacterium hotanense TaxID=649196 RepID=UPI0021A60875|nr:FecR family protein [Sphingobacterium hotanense]MCT1522963.1 FecR domain-containing protein [Sphingobacterium hotanense]
MKLSAEIAALIKKHLEGKLSSTDAIELNQWLAEDILHQQFFDKLTHSDELYEDALSYLQLKSDDSEDWLKSLKAKTIQKIDSQKERPLKRRYNWLGYAAAVILLAAISYIFLIPNWEKKASQNPTSFSDIQPAENKAELRLSNGQTIQLRADKDGIKISEQLTYQDGTDLLKLDDQELSKLTATVQVPKGGKYQVTLPDGSTVFLNASSQLSYPLRFPQERRVVKLEGEAYFSVNESYHQGMKKAFIVTSRDQEVHVTGTEFNISAYPDESDITTTLVEGSVNVLHGQKLSSLKPNQQLTWKNKKATIQTVDVTSFIAWKNNKFLFNETELRQVMKDISRWYDIEVGYSGTIPATYFYGEIERNKNLAEVLTLLEKSGLKFKLDHQGKEPKLIVLP